jgi:predicted amidophosphoribosyltransferase
MREKKRKKKKKKGEKKKKKKKKKWPERATTRLVKLVDDVVRSGLVLSEAANRKDVAGARARHWRIAFSHPHGCFGLNP